MLQLGARSTGEIMKAAPAPGNGASRSTGHPTYREENLPGYGRPGVAALNGAAMKAIFGPNTPRVLQFLTRMRKLSPAEIDRVATSWNKVNPLDRALAWAHLQSATAAKEDYPVIAAASAAPRGHGNRPHAGPQRLGLLGRRLGRRRRHHRR